MTREEAKALPFGTTLRFRDDHSRNRYVRLVGTNGYRFADVETGGKYGLEARRFRVRYERVEVYDPNPPTSSTKVRRRR